MTFTRWWVKVPLWWACGQERRACVPTGRSVPDPGEVSLAVAIGLFVAATVAILLVGTRLTAVADILADRTGLGEAVVGAVLLGGPPPCRGS